MALSALRKMCPEACQGFTRTIPSFSCRRDNDKRAAPVSTLPPVCTWTEIITIRCYHNFPARYARTLSSARRPAMLINTAINRNSVIGCSGETESSRGISSVAALELGPPPRSWEPQDHTSNTENRSWSVDLSAPNSTPFLSFCSCLPAANSSCSAAISLKTNPRLRPATEIPNWQPCTNSRAAPFTCREFVGNIQ
jgi:hypothetical protein